MISKKVHLSLSEGEVAKFDMLRNELGMNVHEAIKDLRTALDITSGPVDQKSKGGEKHEKVKV